MSSNIWIHCNMCFHSFQSRNRKYFVLSCKSKHVLCHCCMAKTNQGRMCPICKMGIKYLEITGGMDPKARDFFDINARERKINEYTAIVEFQDNQVNNLLSHSNEKTEKVKALLEAKPQELQHKIEKRGKARQYRKQLQAQLQEMNKHERSSGYDSMINSRDSRSSSAMSFENSASADEVFGKSRSSSGNLFDDPGLNSSNHKGLVQKSPKRNVSAIPRIVSNPFQLAFHTQKASTPNEASRHKVMTQDFSFRSTPSSGGRLKR